LFAPFAPSAGAAEPFVTDDARILERGACQLETGTRRQPAAREFWLLPTCNLWLNIEAQFGRTTAVADDQARSVSNVVQLKGLWRELERDGYGIGWSVSSEARRHPATGQKRVSEHEVTLLASRAVLSDKFTVHANFGGRWNRDDQRGALTAGALGELELNSRVALLAEVYGSSHVRRGFQAGMRVSVIPDHLDLTLTRGGDDRNERGSRYWALGIQIVSPKLAP
jgi:hypothetical protein